MTNLSGTWDDLLHNVFVVWLPKLAAALLVLIIGLFIAKAIAKLAQRALNTAQLDVRLNQTGIGKFLTNAVTSPTRLLGDVAYWIITLGVIGVAARVAGIPSVNGLVASIYSYLPNVLAALAIFLVAVLVSTGITVLIRNTLGNTPAGKLLETLGPVVVMSISVFMILVQLKIATAIVIITYAALLGSLSLATALAFGLGGRDMAQTLLADTYRKSKDAAASPRPAGTRRSR